MRFAIFFVCYLLLSASLLLVRLDEVARQLTRLTAWQRMGAVLTLLLLLPVYLVASWVSHRKRKL